MAHVQIDDITPTITYTVGASARDEFPFSYAFFDTSDLVVTVGETVMVLDTDYTVTGTAVDSGYSDGTVTLDVAVTNTTVTIERVLPVERTTDFPNSGPFNIPALNTQLDKLIAIDQQQDVRFDDFDDELAAALALFESLTSSDSTANQWASRSAVLSGNLADSVSYIRTAGYSSAGDGGAALYEVVVTPDVTGAFQSLNGVWLQLVPQYLTPEMLGASNDAVDNFTALQAALDVASELAVPLHAKGLYKHSDSLVVPQHVCVDGGSMWATEFRCTTADKPVMKLVGGTSGRNCTVQNFTVSHGNVAGDEGVTPTAGGDGIQAIWGSNDHRVTNIHSLRNYKGFNLGPTSNSIIRGCRARSCANDGLYMSDGTESGAMQWNIDDFLAEGCVRDGGRIEAVTASTNVGAITNFRTFANSGCGLRLQGTSSLIQLSVPDIVGLFIGGDNGDAELYIDTYYTGQIQVTAATIELAGLANTGPTGGTPPAINHNANGVTVTENNSEVHFVNLTVKACQFDGINSKASYTRITGFAINSNGQSGAGAGYRGATAGKKVRLSNGRIARVDGTQQYGIAMADGADMIRSMVEFAGNTVAAENYDVNTGSVQSWP